MCIYGVFVFSLVACYQDCRENKIRNWLIMAGLFWGIYLQCSQNGISGILDFSEGLLGIFLITYPLFRLGMIGAGDVKLFAVCAGSMGLKDGLVFMSCTYLVAAVFSLIKMLYHRSFVERFRYFFNYVKQTVETGELSLYSEGVKQNRNNCIPLAGSVSIAILLCLGGVY